MQRQGPLHFQHSSIRINKPATFIVKERKKFDSISIKNSRVAFPLRFWCQAMEWIQISCWFCCALWRMNQLVPFCIAVGLSWDIKGIQTIDFWIWLVWQSVETVDGQIHVHALDARLSCPPRAPYCLFLQACWSFISCIVKRVSDVYLFIYLHATTLLSANLFDSLRGSYSSCKFSPLLFIISSHSIHS